MNSSIFAQTLLSEASYGEFLARDGVPSEAGIRASLTAKDFSAKQIDELIKSFTALHHRPNTASGFSATLFQNLDANNPGLTLAIRNTETGSLEQERA